MVYVKGTHPNGEDLWGSISSDIEYVISHPNGWEGYQQSQIRSAIVLAGLIPDSVDGNSRVTFVTEGEASLHFAIDYGFPATSMKVTGSLSVHVHLVLCSHKLTGWARRHHCRRWRRDY